MKRACAFLLILLTAKPAVAETLKPLTLADCCAMALKQSEEVALRGELITETEGRVKQALSGVLPNLSFSSTDKRQDGSGNSSFTLKNVPERKFTLSQPLFSGFKEFAALKGSRMERRQREFEKTRAEQILFLDVSDAFHLLLELRKDLEAIDSIRDTLRSRIQELQDREKLGRSRGSEVVAAQAQLYRVEAEWERSQSRAAVAEQLLEFLTGLNAVGELADPGPNLPAADPEEQLLAKSQDRPDVKASEQGVDIAQQQVRVAKAKFFPTVNAEGNYYVDRAGAAEDVKWDASLKVFVPIFQGGAATGATEEASSVLRQTEILLRQNRRRAAQDVRSAYTEYGSALAQTRALIKALEATEESTQYQAKEYRLNLVNNLEVLAGLQTLQNARREVIHALYEARRLYWKLKVSAGESLS